MKKHLKLMSLLLSIALLLISAAPLTANAFDSIDADATVELITPSEDAIYSVYGSAAPAGLCRELAELDVTVANNTLIEIVPMDSGTGTALTVTNSENTTILKDIIFGVDGSGQIASIQPVDENAASPMNRYSTWFSDRCLSLVRASAVYNIVYEDTQYLLTGPLYQPQGLYFIYYEEDAAIPMEVSYVSINYACSGFLVSYPDLEDLSGDFPITHNIQREQPYPAPSTIYSKTKTLTEGTAIKPGEALSALHILSINLVVDGEDISDGVSWGIAYDVQR